jgi:AmmeMemoRadiSam system protein B
MSIRKMAVAGMFYPEDKETLRNEVITAIEQAPASSETGPMLGIIVPHAGYMYSGACAGHGYRTLRDTPFTRAVVIAPSHRYGGYDFTVGDYEAMETPLGAVKVDIDAVNRLMSTNRIGFLPPAHRDEHSLEVQLPFLKMIRPDVRVTPIILGNQGLNTSRELSELLLDTFADQIDETVFIASTDLSHYHSAKEAELLDGRLIRTVEKLDSIELNQLIGSHGCEACGFGAILTLMAIAGMRNCVRSKVLCYTHSGVVTGDNRQVVGYLSAGIWR